MIVAFDHESEEFHARDVNLAAHEPRPHRKHQRADGSSGAPTPAHVAADIALRRDAFNRFKDATTIRASLLADVGQGFSIAGSYGEGIAQPTFFDLYGFFPDFLRWESVA